MSIVARQVNDISCDSLLEKVITTNDLSGLTPVEKVQHIKNICDSIGLNPLTKPIQLLKFQGKEIAYFTKDATEQLRKNNHVSITRVEKSIENDICMVTVYARTPDGREDAATGAVSIAGLKGDALCNAVLKSETKAKRRVTLSICGLGFIDESETDTMTPSRKVNIPGSMNESVSPDDPMPLFNTFMREIEECNDIDSLRMIFENIRKIDFRSAPSILKALIDAKDIKKNHLETLKFRNEMDDSITGEILE